jgi:hypothetical protein
VWGWGAGGQREVLPVLEVLTVLVQIYVLMPRRLLGGVDVLPDADKRQSSRISSAANLQESIISSGLEILRRNAPLQRERGSCRIRTPGVKAYVCHDGYVECRRRLWRGMARACRETTHNLTLWLILNFKSTDPSSSCFSHIAAKSTNYVIWVDARLGCR